MTDERPKDGIPLEFIQMDPELCRKLTEGHEDILTGEAEKAEAIYRQHKNCPRGCGPTMDKDVDVKFAFADSGWLIPRCLMKCSHCGCTINPFDGMVVNLGDPDTANAGGTLIKTDD
jgi:hypothetical protein